MCYNQALVIITPNETISEEALTKFIDDMEEQGLVRSDLGGGGLLVFAGEVYGAGPDSLLNIVDRCRDEKPMTGVFQFGNEPATKFEMAAA